jgi:hypothetical protein
VQVVIDGRSIGPSRDTADAVMAHRIALPAEVGSGLGLRSGYNQHCLFVTSGWPAY